MTAPRPESQPCDYVWYRWMLELSYKPGWTPKKDKPLRRRTHSSPKRSPLITPENMSTPKRDKLLRGLASLAVSHPHFGGYYLEAQDAFAEAESAHAGEPQAGEKIGKVLVELADVHALIFALDMQFAGVGNPATGKDVRAIVERFADVARSYHSPLEIASGGTTNETGKAPAQESVASTQKRQHAGEGKAKTEAEEKLIQLAIHTATHYIPGDIEELLHQAALVAAERAPLVGRPESLD